MGARTDKDVGAAARLDAAHLALVCADPVARVLALRAIERLGRLPPVVYTKLADALAARCDILLIDDGELPADSSAQLASAAPKPWLIVLSAQEGTLSLADACLRKPLTVPALAAALDAADAALKRTGDEALFDPAICDELLGLFGRSGLAEMIAALEQDLPRQHQRLGDALQAQDRAAIKRLAHSLRGVALQFGASRLAADFAALESAALADAPLESLATGAAALLERQALLVRALGSVLDGA